jgi:hypothetical protein
MNIKELEQALTEVNRRANQHLVNSNIATYWRDSAESSEQWEHAKEALAEAELIKKQIEALKLAEGIVES